jgi:hypothetical protein
MTTHRGITFSANKKLVINYTYETEDSSNRMFYTQKLKGEIEYDNTLDLTAVYSGIYLIEPMIGNFSYSRSASTT